MTVTTDPRPARDSAIAREVTARLLAELREFARTTIARVAARAELAKSQIGAADDIVNDTVVKLMNGESALAQGHAVIRNGKLRLTEAARKDPALAEQYAAGLRRWDRENVPLKHCMKLAILSEVRNAARKLVDQRYVRAASGPELSTIGAQHSADASRDLASLLDTMSSARARKVGRALLDGATSVEIRLELRLTRREYDAALEEIRRHVEHLHAPRA